MMDVSFFLLLFMAAAFPTAALIALAWPTPKVRCLHCGYEEAVMSNFMDGIYYCVKCKGFHQANVYKEFSEYWNAKDKKQYLDSTLFASSTETGTESSEVKQ